MKLNIQFLRENIRISTSAKLFENYSEASPPITENWVEGPTAIETEKGWIVYFDRYTNHEMGAIRSINLKDWEDISNEIHFPDGTRHGTVFKVKKKVVDKLLNYF